MNNPLSSSPAFGTPLHALLPNPTQQLLRPLPPAFTTTIAPVLPILLPPQTLRPVAFRIFTKKHNLQLQLSALQTLASSIGKTCGTEWREAGSGEKVLEEVARLWKAENGGLLVEGGKRLEGILGVVGVGGKVGAGRTAARREGTFVFGAGNDSAVDLLRPGLGGDGGRQDSFGISRLNVDGLANDDDDDDETTTPTDPRAWLTVTSAFSLPRLTYSPSQKHFLPSPHPPSLFPPPSQKTQLFRDRYNVIHQRLLRNPAFQAPSFTTVAAKTTGEKTTHYKLTPIANLLGRGSTAHLLLGLLVIAPTGTLALNDLSGSISLDLSHAQFLSGGKLEEGPFFCPGMIVLVDGIYEESFSGAGSSGLGNTGGVGGTIGGRFLGFSIGVPPVERREITLGISSSGGGVGGKDYGGAGSGGLGGGLGWTDFTGHGSERAVGSKMRRLESRLLSPEHSHTSPERRKMVVLAELTLDQPSTLAALRMVLEKYAAAPEPPMAFLCLGNFCSTPAMAGSGTGSIEYKELFDSLAALLSQFPSLLTKSTWIFVPGDNDAWGSSFSAGASGVWPRDGIPELFTSRVTRVFVEAGVERGEVGRSCVWGSNPVRVFACGGVGEVVVCRDDVLGRLRRGAVRVGQATSGGDGEGAGASGEQEEEGGDGDVVMSGALPTTEDLERDDLETTNETPALDETPTNTTSAKQEYTTRLAKRTILSLLPQSTLSPFPLSTRPVHWDYATSALGLYPLPHCLVLADAGQEASSVRYEGCCVLNPGSLVVGAGMGMGRGGKRKKVQWGEWDFGTKRGRVEGGWVG
ncbi:DNA-directed DNA polymerase epsilon, subunit B [Elasticomyces elasticus]|nr:DNA-directed DNA polymerase epsilon, subunit B [Elasticomyces elasticus]KAK4979377.1 DNA-directed DNA polymerase epsilon, subunit B [Elasticomyces elasticus]